MRTLLVALIVVCHLPVHLPAQDLGSLAADVVKARDGSVAGPNGRLTGFQQGAARPEPSIVRPMLFGAGLGAASWVAGGLIGYGLSNTDSCSGDSFCGLGGFLLGAAIGGSSGLVVGMHLGNNRRGSLPLGWLTSLGIWGAGVGIVLAMSDDVASEGGRNVVLAAIPVAQFAFTLLVERSTGRSRARREGGLGLAVVPRPDGGLGVGLSFPVG